MRKYLTVVASFIVMLCIGSVYAWSIIAAKLIEDYGFSAFQSQLIFGALIAIFPVTMIFVGRMGEKVKHRFFGYTSGVLFLSGYLLAGYSEGSFALTLLGIGVLAGIGTGFGYWVALTSPVQWFPEKKGLITGIAAGGFGLGAVLMSELSDAFFSMGYNILELLKIVGIAYGILIFIFSNFIYEAQTLTGSDEESENASDFIHSKVFRRLFFGLFLGTFAGLLVIGSLRLIGSQYIASDDVLILGISLFAIANFLGRVVWGYISDKLGASFSIFCALLFQAVSIFSLNISELSDASYLFLAVLIGFGFGGNFVLFAKETAQVFGVKNLGTVYPFVFIGYAIAGIAGPISGGILYDYSGSFFMPILLASFMSLMGSLLFLKEFIRSRKKI